MAKKKRSASSRPAKRTSMSAESIFSRPMSKKQRAVVSRIAKRQAGGDDSGIDYSDIPPLTREQLAQFRRNPRCWWPLASTGKFTTGSCSMARATRPGSTVSCAPLWRGPVSGSPAPEAGPAPGPRIPCHPRNPWIASLKSQASGPQAPIRVARPRGLR